VCKSGRGSIHWQFSFNVGPVVLAPPSLLHLCGLVVIGSTAIVPRCCNPDVLGGGCLQYLPSHCHLPLFHPVAQTVYYNPTLVMLTLVTYTSKLKEVLMQAGGQHVSNLAAAL
jgi:hypothetical protein